MRIVHIEDRFHPDLGYQINYFAKFHNPGDDFFIITSDSLSIWGNFNSDNIFKKDKDFEEKYQVKIIRLKALFSSGQKSNIWLIGLVKTIYEINPTVIYSHCVENYSSIRIILSKLRHKYRIVTDTHTLYNQINYSLKQKIYYKFFKLFVASKINQNVIPVFYTALENKEILEKIYNINNERIFASLIGTDTNLFSFDEQARINLRNELGISPADIVLLFTGKFNSAKQPHLILEALTMIQNRIEAVLHVVFVGSVNQKYFEKFFHHKISSSLIKIHKLDAVPNNDLYKFYSMADFAVFPRENTLSSLDAQACKLPVIMENDRTNAERLQHGGLLFEKGNIADLGEKILFMIKNTEARIKMGIKGQIFIKQNYSYNNIIKNTEQIIDLILKI